jgi:hypothetical protein
VRIFIVVSKRRRELYQYFADGLAGIDPITVILDRRLGPDDPEPLGASPASGERRVPRDIYDEMESRGFVIVRLPS